MHSPSHLRFWCFGLFQTQIDSIFHICCFVINLLWLLFIKNSRKIHIIYFFTGFYNLYRLLWQVLQSFTKQCELKWNLIALDSKWNVPCFFLYHCLQCLGTNISYNKHIMKSIKSTIGVFPKFCNVTGVTLN